MAGRRTKRTRALVLDTTKLGEQDLILTLLGETGVQLRAVAKGARKPGGRLAARSELFCESDFLITEGRNLGIVSEATTVDAHVGLRGDLARVSAASAVSELSLHNCNEDAPDPYLYPLCSRALRACEEAEDRAHLLLVVAAFSIKLLSHCGWRPELDSCVACGDFAVSRFSTAAGGVICSSCAQSIAGAEELSKEEILWLRALISLTFDQLLTVSMIDTLALRLALLAHGWASSQLECRLRAGEFFLGL